MSASGSKDSVTITMPGDEWRRILDNSTKYTEMVKMMVDAKEELDRTSSNFTFDNVKVEKTSMRHSSAPVVLDVDTEPVNQQQTTKSDTPTKASKNNQQKPKKRKRVDSESSTTKPHHSTTTTTNTSDETVTTAAKSSGVESTSEQPITSQSKKPKISEVSNEGKAKRLSVEKKASIIAKFIKKTGENIGTQTAMLAKIEEFATELGHNFKANNIKLFIAPILKYIKTEQASNKNHVPSWEASDLVDYFNKAKEKATEKKNSAAEKVAKKSAKDSDSSSDSDSDDDGESSQPAPTSTKTQQAVVQQSPAASQIKTTSSKSPNTNTSAPVVKLATTDLARKVYEEKDDDHSNMESSDDDDDDDSDMVDDSDMEPDDDEE